MPRPGVFFSSLPAPGAGLSARADVALFAGLVARRAAVEHLDEAEDAHKVVVP